VSVFRAFSIIALYLLPSPRIIIHEPTIELPLSINQTCCRFNLSIDSFAQEFPMSKPKSLYTKLNAWSVRSGQMAARCTPGWRTGLALQMSLVVVLGLITISLAAPTPVFAQPIQLPFPTCDPRAFLFQSIPADVFAVNLVTGASTQLTQDGITFNANAFAYNPLDDYVYSFDNTTGDPTNKQIHCFPNPL